MFNSQSVSIDKESARNPGNFPPGIQTFVMVGFVTSVTHLWRLLAGGLKMVTTLQRKMIQQRKRILVHLVRMRRMTRVRAVRRVLR